MTQGNGPMNWKIVVGITPAEQKKEKKNLKK